MSKDNLASTVWRETNKGTASERNRGSIPSIRKEQANEKGQRYRVQQKKHY